MENKFANIEFEDLNGVISLQGFDYAKYLEHERQILQPRLQGLGFTAIVWGDGERDSFGPLTRVCSCIDLNGTLHHFIYG